MAVYMKFAGGNPKGNVTAKGYEDWIELDSFSFGVGRGISMETGNLANREATRPSISEITLSKSMDAASGGLFKEALGGVEGVEVVIDVVQTGAKEVQKYAQYKLTDCLISSYSVNASASGAPFESLSLSFAKIELDLSNADKANKNSSTGKFGYCLTTAALL